MTDLQPTGGAVTAPDSSPFHRVVVIGSGFGALETVKALKRVRGLEIMMIAKTNHHLFQPLLYQVATGVLSPGEIAPATRDVLRNQDNLRILGGEVTDIDTSARTVTSQFPTGPITLRYDTLVVAAGAGQSYFGNDHFAQYAPGMKSIDDALELRGRIFGAFEAAELAATQGADPEEIARLLTFVMVGAGPTGVEMAGQIAELAQRSFKSNFRAIHPSAARVVLVDGIDDVLSNFGEKLSAKAAKELTKRGVELQMGQMVVDVDLDGVTLRAKDGTESHIPSLCKMWAAGVKASPLGAQLAEQTGAGIDRAGRVEVEPDGSLPGHPEVFVIGDMIKLKDYPGVAQVAIQGGKHAAGIIKDRVYGKQPLDQQGGPFKYFDKGSMATISRFKAVASVGKIQLSGFIAWLMWLVVHLIYLVGFKNRITTLLHWGVSFVGRGRSERVITIQQVIARTAIEADGSTDPLARPWRAPHDTIGARARSSDDHAGDGVDPRSGATDGENGTTDAAEHAGSRTS